MGPNPLARCWGPHWQLGVPLRAKEAEKEEEGDVDTLDSDEFCILDAPGLSILVCGGQAGARARKRVLSLGPS